MVNVQTKVNQWNWSEPGASAGVLRIEWSAKEQPKQSPEAFQIHIIITKNYHNWMIFVLYAIINSSLPSPAELE